MSNESHWLCRAVLMVVAVCNAAAASGQPQWVALAPIGVAPPPRAGHSAVYDQQNNRMIIFGGYTSGTTLLNDVWVLTNASGSEAGVSEWQQLFPLGEAPSPRSGHVAFYDSQYNMMHVFGGRTASGDCSCELWTLLNANGNGVAQWQKENVPCSLGQRIAFISAYAETANTLLIAGGSDCAGGALLDAFKLGWIYPSVFPSINLTPVPDRWQQLTTNALPVGTQLIAQRTNFYDAQSDELYVWGALPYPELLVLSAATTSSPHWRSIRLAGGPSDLEAAQFHPGARRAIALTMQLAGKPPYMQAWRLNLPVIDFTTQWNPVDVFLGPTARSQYSLAFDGLSDRLIMFGGELFPLPGGGGVVIDTLVLRNAVGAEPAPAITTSTSYLSFGNEILGLQATRTFQLGNRGNAPLPIITITADRPEFSATHNCGTSVDPGTECTVTVTFRPLTNRIEIADLTIETASGDATVEVSGTGAPGLIALPEALTLPTASFYSNTQDTILLSNPSDSSDIAIASIDVTTGTGHDANILRQTNNCGSRLARSSKCQITVIASDVATGAVIIQSSASTVPQLIPIEVYCTGVIVNPHSCDHGGCPLATGINTDAPGVALVHYALAGREVKFSTSAALLSPRWTFGDDTTGAGGTIDHMFAAPRIYNVAVDGLTPAEPGDPFCSLLPARGHLLLSVQSAIGFVDASAGRVGFCAPNSSKSVLLTNTGNTPVTLFGTSIDGNAGTQRLFNAVVACSTIAPGAICPLDIRYTASTLVPYGGTLNVFHSGASSPLQIELTAGETACGRTRAVRPR